MKKLTLGPQLLITLTIGLLTNNVYAAPVDRAIKKLDTDGDGLISQQEFQAGERGMVKRLDSNNDGAVTQEEINEHIAEKEAQMADRLEMAKARISAHFIEADINADGSVTQEEARSAMFSKIDANADGYLTPEELKEGRPDRHHGKRGRFGHHGNVGPADEV